MLDSVATQQGTAPGGILTVLDASADDVGVGALPPYLVMAGSGGGSAIATPLGVATQSGFNARGGSSGIGTAPSASGDLAHGGIGSWGPVSRPGSPTTTTAAGSPVPPNESGMATVVPDTRYVRVEGSLDPTEDLSELADPHRADDA